VAAGGTGCLRLARADIQEEAVAAFLPSLSLDSCFQVLAFPQVHPITHKFHYETYRR